MVYLDYGLTYKKYNQKKPQKNVNICNLNGFFFTTFKFRTI